MNKNVRVASYLLIAASASAAVIAGCSGGKKSDNSIKIGGILALTGAYAASGVDNVKAVQLAIDEINAGGGVLGKKISLLNKNDDTDPAQATVKATELAAAGVGIVVGSISSSETLAGAAVLTSAHIVQISNSATSPLLTTYPDQGYLFRTCASDALQGKLLAKRARARGFTKVNVIHTDDAYGQGLADAFVAQFTSTAGTSAASYSYVSAGTPPTTAMASALLTSAGLASGTPPQAVVLISVGQDAVVFLKQWEGGGFSTSTYWYFSDSLEDASGFVQAGLTAGVSFTFLHEGTGPTAPATATYQTFATSFEAKNGAPPGAGNYDANIYDAVYLAAMAMEKGGAADGPTIHNNLQSVSSGGTAVAPGNWATIKGMIDAGTDVNYDGASGNVDFDGDGDVVAPYDIWAVVNTNGSFQISIKQSGVSP